MAARPATSSLRLAMLGSSEGFARTEGCRFLDDAFSLSVSSDTRGTEIPVRAVRLREVLPDAALFDAAHAAS